jgi:hypothetical protein
MHFTLFQLYLVALLYAGEQAVRKTAARYVISRSEHEIARGASAVDFNSRGDLDSCRQVPTVQCENTAAGRHFLTDSHGYVCSRRELDYTSGCCNSGDIHSCETCAFPPHGGAVSYLCSRRSFATLTFQCARLQMPRNRSVLLQLRALCIVLLEART